MGGSGVAGALWVTISREKAARGLRGLIPLLFTGSLLCAPQAVRAVLMAAAIGTAFSRGHAASAQESSNSSVNLSGILSQVATQTHGESRGWTRTVDNCYNEHLSPDTIISSCTKVLDEIKKKSESRTLSEQETKASASVYYQRSSAYMRKSQDRGNTDALNDINKAIDVLQSFQDVESPSDQSNIEGCAGAYYQSWNSILTLRSRILMQLLIAPEAQQLRTKYSWHRCWNAGRTSTSRRDFQRAPFRIFQPR